MKLPEEIKKVLHTLTDAGFEAYAVGGCVRDLLLNKTPSDWDITTNARPEEIQKLFPDSFYENAFGTVGIKTRSDDSTLAVVEATPFRIEGKYTDKRHPDKVTFAKKLEDDLGRRDFTINAMALKLKTQSEKRKTTTQNLKQKNETEIIDLYGGQKDLANKLIHTVGEPEQRFSEDALRLMRAVRFAAQIGFIIEDKTLESIKKKAGLLSTISKERIRDELTKIIMSDNAKEGVELLYTTGLLSHVLPELQEGIGVEQNLHHIYTVWEHGLNALEYAAKKKYPLEVRLASLFHDIGKPKSKRGEGRHSTFYGHEVIGERIVAKIMTHLKFPQDVAEKIVALVRYHMFFYNVGEVTESSVRRLMAKVGKENMDDLIRVREADRIGSGRPKAVPYKLRHFKYMIDKVSHDPISPKMLKMNGEDIMKLLGIESGPKVGMIIHALMEDVLDDPSKNTDEYLVARVRELGKLSDEKLAKLKVSGKDKIEEKEEKTLSELKHKHYVE